MPARKIPERVCVVAGKQQWAQKTSSAGACISRDHMHLSGGKAVDLVEHGSAEWLYETWTDRKGKEHHRALPAIRLLGKKRWKGVLSDRGSGAPMKVMQLVRN